MPRTSVALDLASPRAGSPLVLIISAPEDVHASAVARELDALGARAEILDLREFPSRLRVSLGFGAVHRVRLRLANGREIDAADITAVWWRRPQRPVVPPEIRDETHRRFALNEAYCALNGLWHCLPARWVNPPSADAAAAHKPFQLRVAPLCGLAVPDTLVTNDPADAAAFIERHGDRVVYKALAGLPDAWRETRRLRSDERQLLPFVRYAPVIFQELVEGDDLRVTVVGREIFAARMETARSRYPYDVRMDMTVPVSAVRLEPKVSAALLQLMERLGLAYGAVDLRRRPDGSYVFFEINPAGQFLYIEELARLPISRAVAALLAHGNGAEP